MEKLIRAVLALAAAWGLAIFLCRCWLVVGLRYQLEYGEGQIIGLAYWLKHGLPIYSPNPNPPWAFGFHFPLYIWLLSVLMGPTPSFFEGRLLSSLGMVVVLIGSFAWLWRRGGPISALAGLAFITLHPILLGWGPLERVDNPAFCFSVLAILTSEIPVLSGLFCLLSLFCKQSYIAAPLAIGLSRPFKKGLAFLVGYGSVALLLAWTLSQTAFPGMLSMHSKLTTDPGSALTLWLTFAPTVALLAGLAWLVPGDIGGVTVLRRYAFTSLLPVLAALKQGAYYNYFMEIHWCLSMLAALSLARPNRLRRALAAAQLVVGSISHFPIFESPLAHWRYETAPWLMGREPAWIRHMREYDQLGEILDKNPGPVLAEQCGNPLVFGKESIVCDCFALFFDQARAGFNLEPLLEMVRQRKIAVILLQRLDESNLRVPPAAIQLILENYDVVGYTGRGGDYILLPKPAGPSL
ncbi:MAG: hypothetical protein KF760_22765 [Candidatus Eremiobacteraeota bacterium]|nr:hypothetical protein [Candidatus Eremiobacteraeota bacterium]MCW5869702.1 hypothetical protein [Candidatus Eremiobacteraeota bacterium]